ncbi:MAG: class I SAM-dependent methyltransferase [Legionellaceae bacterium]|nr:class I SAM-dependent methyltransferase [Legionellaceae bacterium]
MKKSRTVIETYKKMYEWYDEHRSRDLFEKYWLDKALFFSNSNSKILDLGCGMGEPIAKYFLDHGYELTGVDSNENLLSLAASRLPKGEFLVADMRSLSLDKKFDLIIAWNSFFHLTQDEQRKMFVIFANHLNSGGVLLFTSGPEEGEIWSNNGGEDLYHASKSPEEYKQILKQHQFELLEYKIEDPDCNGHTVWLVKAKF